VVEVMKLLVLLQKKKKKKRERERRQTCKEKKEKKNPCSCPSFHTWIELSLRPIEKAHYLLKGLLNSIRWITCSFKKKKKVNSTGHHHFIIFLDNVYRIQNKEHVMYENSGRRSRTWSPLQSSSATSVECLM
jgi:hypothetical protein